MRSSNRIFYALSLFILGFLFQSCSDDTLSDADVVAEEFRNQRNNGGGRGGNGGGNNGGGNNGGDNQGGIEVDELDTDILEDWTSLLLEIERYAGGMRPNASARALAYIYMAAYETGVPGMDDYISNSRRLDGFDINMPDNNTEIDFEIALNSSLSKAIDHFIINLPADLESSIGTFEDRNFSILSDGVSDLVVENSTNWGEYVAEQVIAYAITDEEAESQIFDPQPRSYEPPTGDGYWTYSADPERALFPYWESVRTFVISSEETSSVPPVAYSTDTNSNYYEQMMEVVESNDTAKEGIGEGLHIAEFWSDDVEGLMMSPPARQVAIANQLIVQEELDLEEALVLFVKLGFSLNDAAVSTWADKYEHMVMRPSNYIHQFIDRDFQTNLYRLVYWPNPSFPGYPSGHSCFASAAAGVFIDAFGNRTQFTDRTHEGRTEFLSEPRTFSTLEEMAAENAFSRIPLGVHIRMDCTEGLRLGYEIADAVNDLELRERS